MEFENTIGLETHVQLKTQTKIFCSCLLKTGCEPNTNVCPVCLGYPGVLPVMNKEAVKLTVMSGMMLGCEINKHATFDRKNYFYPDMAKDYQISENGNPLCIGGGVNATAGITVRGPALKRGEWNDLTLTFDQAKAVIEVNGVAGESVDGCGYEGNPHATAFGCSVSGDGFFGGRVSDLRIRPY